MNFEFQRAARKEFDQAADWYEDQQPGLGDRFIDVILALVDRICKHPTSFPVVEENARQAITREFPYSILYRIEANRVVIIAIFHSSRDPATWQNRL